MTTGPDFDLAMTEWLADGPLRAPAGTVEAAIRIARRSSAHPLPGSRLGRRVMSRLTVVRPARGFRPGLALAAVIAVLGLVAAGVVGAWLAQRSAVPRDDQVAPIVSSSPSPAETAAPSSLPSGLVGTWSTVASWELTLALEPCAIGEACGTAQRLDDNEEACAYGLVYRSRTADVLTFDLGEGTTFGCGYSPWSGGPLEVTFGPNDTLRATVRAAGSPSYTLHRVDPRSAVAVLGGAWSGSPAEEVGDVVTIAFAPCRDGRVCGTGKWQHTSALCAFTLVQLMQSAMDEGAFDFVVESADSMMCSWGGPDNNSTFRVEAAPDGTLELRNSRSMPAVTLGRDSD